MHSRGSADGNRSSALSRKLVDDIALHFSACLPLPVFSVCSCKICVHLGPSVVFLFAFALVAAPLRQVLSWFSTTRVTATGALGDLNGEIAAFPFIFPAEGELNYG